MYIRRLLMLFVCGISILYTHTGHTQAVEKISGLSALQEDTDLRNIEDISQGILYDIEQQLPKNALKESTVFVPQVQYSSNTIPIKTVFDTVFTQALQSQFTKHGIAIASYNNKERIVHDYSIRLKDALKEKALFEKKNAEEIKGLRNDIVLGKQDLLILKRELEEYTKEYNERYKEVLNSKQANESLIIRHREHNAREENLNTEVSSLENTLKTLQSEMDILQRGEARTIAEIKKAEQIKDNVSPVFSIDGTPITEKNSIEEKDRERYINQSKAVVSAKKLQLQKIRIALQERTSKISDIHKRLFHIHNELTAMKHTTSTLNLAVEQSNARVSYLEKELGKKATDIAIQEEKIRQSEQNIYALESKIIALQQSNPIKLPTLYEIKISYSTVESVLFITAEVSSGIHNTTVYLSKYTARVTPYTAMLLQQEPISLKKYNVRSVSIPKPNEKHSTKIQTIANEKGIH